MYPQSHEKLYLPFRNIMASGCFCMSPEYFCLADDVGHVAFARGFSGKAASRPRPGLLTTLGNLKCTTLSIRLRRNYPSTATPIEYSTSARGKQSNHLMHAICFFICFLFTNSKSCNNGSTTSTGLGKTSRSVRTPFQNRGGWSGGHS